MVRHCSHTTLSIENENAEINGMRGGPDNQSAEMQIMRCVRAGPNRWILLLKIHKTDGRSEKTRRCFPRVRMRGKGSSGYYHRNRVDSHPLHALFTLTENCKLARRWVDFPYHLHLAMLFIAIPPQVGDHTLGISTFVILCIGLLGAKTISEAKV